MVGAYCINMKGRSQLGRLEVTTYCQQCAAFTLGIAAGKSNDRCTECGCYTSQNPDVCCTVHEVRESPYPSGVCPYCEEERRIKAERQHQATRDPTLEPY
jgi:hypothetical protein